MLSVQSMFTCKSNAASRVNVAILSFQELTAAEEEAVEEDKEKQLQVSHLLLFFPHATTLER